MIRRALSIYWIVSEQFRDLWKANRHKILKTTFCCYSELAKGLEIIGEAAYKLTHEFKNSHPKTHI